MKLPSIIRVCKPKPSTPTPGPDPKAMVRLLGEVRDLITVRQAEIRATAALLVLGLMLGAVPAWSESRCATLEWENGHKGYWCSYDYTKEQHAQGVTAGLILGGGLGVATGALVAWGFTHLVRWKAETRAAMAEETLANVRVHLREAPRSYDVELDAIDRRR